MHEDQQDLIHVDNGSSVAHAEHCSGRPKRRARRQLVHAHRETLENGDATLVGTDVAVHSGPCRLHTLEDFEEGCKVTPHNAHKPAVCFICDGGF